jgi:hypothetical protein
MGCPSRVYFVIVLLAKKEAPMDERERDYLKQQIHELERSKRRWRLATFTLAAALAIVLIVGGMSSLPVLQLVREREAMVEMERARYEAEAARRQAVQNAALAERLGAMEKNAKPKAEKKEIGPRN